MDLPDRRKFLRNVFMGAAGMTIPVQAGSIPVNGRNAVTGNNDPVECAYAPPGEYIKDHSFLYVDGWWHFFSISGTEGYYHGYNGNEETISWSISKDLVNWEFRGHVLHASQWPGAFDQHEVWAPFIFRGTELFYLFYAGIVHPHRPMEYRKMGHDHPWISDGHQEAMGLAISTDLTYWDKIADFREGLRVKGRDAHVVRDEQNKRYLLYSTLNTHHAHVSQSADLYHWEPLGVCLVFPELDPDGDYGATTSGISSYLNSAESLNVMKHPVSGQWIIMGNWQYAISDNPVDFSGSEVRVFDRSFEGKTVDMGFACEMVEMNGKWYRSGVFGKRDYWKLGFTEISWEKDGAFRIVKPSVLA